MDKYGDATVSGKINGYDCKVPFSFLGILFQNKYPLYDKQLGRICSYVKSILNRPINIVDVGANIGDTVLGVGDKENKYLLVEGEETYSSYINNNLKGFDYILYNGFCTDTNTNNTGKVSIKKNGTAHLIDSNNNIKADTIDNIVNDSDFIPDILKIDTDGFDFKVLRGAKKIIQEYKPVIFFEWTYGLLMENEKDPISIFSLLKKIERF